MLVERDDDEQFEALLLPSLAGKLNKTLTTRWTNFPGARRALALPVYALAKSLLDRNDPTPTAEFLAILDGVPKCG